MSAPPASTTAPDADGVAIANEGVQAFLERRFEEAAKLYARSCARGVGQACHNLALMLDRGEGVAANGADAREFLAHSCVRLSHGPSCFALASLLRRGGPATDGERGSATSASAAAAAEEAAADPKKAVAALEVGCHLEHHPSCTTLGIMRMNGEGTEADTAGAAHALALACRGGEAAGCTALGGTWGTGALQSAAVTLAAGRSLLRHRTWDRRRARLWEGCSVVAQSMRDGRRERVPFLEAVRGGCQGQARGPLCISVRRFTVSATGEHVGSIGVTILSGGPSSRSRIPEGGANAGNGVLGSGKLWRRWRSVTADLAIKLARNQLAR